MTLNEYQLKAIRTAKELDNEQLVENGILGLFGEGGEIADIYKKYKFQGHILDVDHIKEELGDVMWYVSILAQGLGIQLDDVAKENVKKLEKRYPNGFEKERSINRKEYELGDK